MAAPQKITLTTGTNDEIDVRGLLSPEGLADETIIAISNDSDNPLTGLTMQVRAHESMQWQTYLSGTDWTAASNPLLRKFNNVDPTTLAPGAQLYAIVFTNGVADMRLTASGTAGTKLRVLVIPIYNRMKGV